MKALPFAVALVILALSAAPLLADAGSRGSVVRVLPRSAPVPPPLPIFAHTFKGSN